MMVVVDVLCRIMVRVKDSLDVLGRTMDQSEVWSRYRVQEIVRLNEEG